MSGGLKPCPSCESGDLVSWPDDYGHRTVYCQSCGMCGPTFGAIVPMFGINDKTLDEWCAADDAARLKAEAAWNALPRRNVRPATLAFVAKVENALATSDMLRIHFGPALGARFVKEHKGGDV